MKKYRVLENFTDLQDDCYEYRAGNEYPRPGLTPTQERIQELSSENNSRKVAVIAVINNKRSKNA